MPRMSHIDSSTQKYGGLDEKFRCGSLGSKDSVQR